MCGICGIFEYQQRSPVSEEQIRRMTNCLIHRGPDDEGFLYRPGVGLGVRRLSIIDVAGGHQPIANEDNTIWVVFNGEIYNYTALRELLVRRGHYLRTRSDTEVILHLYEEYGERCLEHLDGMFAFALYDERPAGGPVLMLARDRVGKKPLYYADVDGALIFGSELKPLLLDARVGRDLDLDALHHYLTLSMIPAPRTIFQSVRKLPAGTLLVCDASGIRMRRYWYYPSLVQSRSVTEDDVVEEVRRLLFAAVQRRLIAEVPLGAFLSGGLDSSTVVAVMARLSSERVKTFSIGFEGPDDYNELPYAGEVAAHLRTDHHAFVVRPDVVEIIHNLVRFADEPFAIASAIPTYLLARAARQTVTVVLTGDGGDEVFAGYPRYLYERWSSAYRHLPTFADRILVASVGLLDGRGGQLADRIARFVATARQQPEARRLGWGGGFTEHEKTALYDAPLAAGTATTEAMLASLVPRDDRSEAAAWHNQLDIVLWLPDEMLAKVDRMTMAASLEARCPLLDTALMEYLAQLDFRTKVPGVRGYHLKHLLRRVAGDLLPARLVARGKHGFDVPLDVWFRGAARPFVEATLSRERIRSRGLFDPEAVASLLRRHLSRKVNAGYKLFALLVFEVWAQEHL